MVKMKKELFFLFMFAFSISYSVYSASFPEKADYIFGYEDLLGLLSKNRISLLDVSKINEGTAISVFKYTDRKVISKPFIYGQEIIAPVENGIVILSPQLQEKKFIPLESEVKYISEKNDKIYVLTGKRIYRLKISASLVGEETEIEVNQTIEEITKGKIEEIGEYVYVVGDDRVEVFYKDNMSSYSSFSIPEIVSSVVLGNDLVVIDKYGNIYRLNGKEGLWNAGYVKDPFDMYRVGNNLVVFDIYGNMYVWRGIYGLTGELPKPSRVYSFGDGYFSNVYEDGSSGLIVIGRKSIYYVDLKERYPLVEKELKTNIVSSAFLGERLIVLTSNNELFSFSKEELRKGCFIISPKEYETIGYLDVELKIMSKDSPEVYFGNKRIPLKKKEDYYYALINPEDFKFGKIIIECKGDEVSGKVVVFREEDGPRGVFSVFVPDEIEEGELLNITVRNQEGEEVNNFTFRFSRNLVFTNNPVEVKLSPGEYNVVLSKRGYYEFRKKLIVKESFFTTTAKVVASLLIFAGIIYLLNKRGVFDGIKKRIKEKIEKMK